MRPQCFRGCLRVALRPPETEPEKPEPEPQADPPPEPDQPQKSGETNPSSDGESSLKEETAPEKPDISREAKDMERKMRSWRSPILGR